MKKELMVPVLEDDCKIIGVISTSDILKEKLSEKFVTIGRERTVTTTLGEALLSQTAEFLITTSNNRIYTIVLIGNKSLLKHLISAIQ